MDKNGKLGRHAALALAATILTTALTGCGTSLPSPGDGAGKTSSGTGRSVTPTQQREEVPTTPRSPYDDDVDTNIPQPIPQPEQPSDPAKINVRVVANTVTSNPLATITSAVQFNRTSVYTTITWSKAEGVAQYRVSRREEGAADDKFYIRANVPASFRGYQDGGLMNLKIGIKYEYRVEALDATGNVIAAGEENATPLYPLAIPAKDTLEPADGAEMNGKTPEFKWGNVKEASGYYVEVFSSVTLLSMWRGYREHNEASNITYGQQVDIMPGTLPAVWTQVLNPAGTYTWSVTAIKTDDPNALKAKAWAKSNTPAMRFYMGKKPVGGK